MVGGTHLRLLIFLVALLVSLPVTGGIYKWIDEEGKVHFGDTPPSNRQTKEIEVAPTPSQNAVREAGNRAKRLREFERAYREDKEDSVQPEQPKQAEKMPVSYSMDIECFTPVVDSWGGRITDSREHVVRKQWSENELRHVTGLLRPLAERRWSGVQEEITCISHKATPPIKSENYDFRLSARWESDQLLGMEADLIGQEQGLTYRQFFWILLSPEGLRFRSATTDTSFDIDQPGNDAEVLTVGSTELTFFWRRGGNTRKAYVFSLRRSGSGYALAQFSYTQGILSGKRLWKLNW